MSNKETSFVKGIGRGIKVSLLTLAAGLAATPVWADPPPPRKIVAVLDATQNFGNTRRAVNFYDVTDLSGGSVFNQSPLFSIWSGYEDASTLNFEDPGAIAVNPINGSVYMAAFDSGPVGVPDAGDTQGVYDLYRLDYQAALNDFVTNSRPAGTMYAPAVGPDGAVNPQHPQHSGSTVNLPGASAKIGEVARAQNGPFYDYAVDFVDPSRLVMLDNQTGLDTDPDIVANDHQIRLLERVAGPATYNAATNEGGFNGQTTESWESTIGALVDMDAGTGRSEPVDISAVSRDGTVGVWVGESDGGGDDVSFFEIDFNAGTATKKELRVNPSPYPEGFALDQDPTVDPSTNDGTLDWIRVDGNGNLLIGESGFFDGPPPEEPKVIGREIVNYDGADTDSNLQNEVVVGGWSTSANLPSPSADDDAAVTDGRFVTVDKGTGEIYFFDVDSGGQPDVAGDVYVFDPATGSFTYEEQNAVNHFLERQGIELFLRGDVTGDGLITDADIDSLFAAILDPTLGGEVSAAVGAEWLDLTSDLALTTLDVETLVEDILNTAFGDTNLDGAVSFADFQNLQSNFNQPGGWADGDLNGDGFITFADFQLLQANFGFNNMIGPAPLGDGLDFAQVPEPSTFALMGVALVGLWQFARQRRGRSK